MHHLARVGVLHQLLADPRLERQGLCIRHLVGSNDARADRPRPHEVLARRDMRRSLLIVTHAAFVEDGVAGHHVERLGTADVFAVFADNDREFDLPVEVLGHLGAH